MFVLKKRKYNWFDMWRMPFECAPVSTVAVTAQKLVTALANVFQVIVVAEFLDGAIRAVTNRDFDRETIVWFALMLLLVSWKRVSFHIGNLFTNYALTQGNAQISEQITEKKNRMEYYLLEDPGTEELSNRITGKLEQTLWNNLQWFLNLFIINIPRTAGVLIIMSGYVWWLSLIVLGLTLPLFVFSLKNGSKVYQAVKDAAVYERRHKYLFGVLTGRETVEERSLFGYTGQVSRQWHGQFEEARRLNLKSSILYMVNSLRGAGINSLLSAVVVVIMIPLAVSGRLSVGVFISLASSVYDLIDIMGWNTARAVNQVATAQEFMKDFTAFAALPEREDSGEKGSGRQEAVPAEKGSGQQEAVSAEKGSGQQEAVSAEKGSGQQEAVSAEKGSGWQRAVPAEKASGRQRAVPAEKGSGWREAVPALRGSEPQGMIPALRELEFKNVTFRYPGTDIDILKDFSLKLESGRHYAVVGENGAGKTTLIKLLTGLYREYEGEILYNGIELRTFPRDEWFRLFSCVFQDFARYYLSVEENICLGTGDMGCAAEECMRGHGEAKNLGETKEPRGTKESGKGKELREAEKPGETKELWEAKNFGEREAAQAGSGRGESREEKARRLARMEAVAKQLDIHDAVTELKNGYQTRLGKLDEDSLDLSGGQWQRVAMARALMNDAPLLILDEPTAALDPVSESRLYEEFGEISRNRTTIFISHRLGSIKLSDYIFVLKDGCVREQGSHEELIRLRGIYANMYETQQSWYDQEKGEEA